MSLRVLFTHSYFLPLDGKQWRAGKPYPPLGTLYAAAAVREAGHEVAVLDTQFARGHGVLPPALDARRPDVLVIYDDGFNWQTKMCLAVMEREALAMVREAKARGIHVVVSGSDATDHRPAFLAAGADHVLLGEGEVTLVELLAAIEEGRPDAGIVGLARMADGVVVESGRRGNLPDPDVLPRPAWDLVDLAPYERMWRRRHGTWSLNLCSSRGCPYGCAWCAKPLYGRTYSVHSPARVVDDLAHLRSRHALDHVWFGDDIFGLTAEWTGELGERVEAAGVKTPFTIQTRADLVVKDDLRRGLVRAGLRTAWLGAESGSQKVLDAMNKGLRVEETREAVRLLREDGVEVGLFLQYGYLGEDAGDVRRTLDLVRDLVPDDLGISVSYPLPGTPFHEQVRGGMGEKTNWTASDDLDLMYPGAQAPSYYRRLHRYTHRVFRTRRGISALRRLSRHPLSATRRDLRAAAATLLHAPASTVDALSLWLQER